MRIAIFGEANNLNQGELDNSGTEITSAQQAGDLYGYGSPLHLIMRILRPNSGGGVGGIPTIVYAQDEPAGASEKEIDLTPTGTATGNGTHTIKIAGRPGLDGEFYDINIEDGDTVADICDKITDAVNNVLGCPMTAVDGTTKVTLTSKWKGLTAEDLVVTVDTNGDALGISYATASVTTGAGTPSIQAALDMFGNEWNTIVLNGYGLVSTVLDTLEAFNGIPNASSPTGRFAGIVFKPFVAVSGSTVDDPSSITDARSLEVTNAVAPAPLSSGLPFEAAANMVRVFARKVQDTPQLDVGGDYYPDMPTPTDIGSMGSYVNRDAISKKGCSTVSLSEGLYKIQDFITTYHKAGEIPPQFKYCRNLMLDFNVYFGYYLLELINVVDHVIANDKDTVTAEKVIKPKMWKAVLSTYADGLTRRGLIVDPDFFKSEISVVISSTNPDRLETRFRYKRSSIVRIASTTAVAGFNLGSN
jgi:phage tail sheath gpL-like